MSTMPTLFLSHGGPDIILSDTPARNYLESVVSQTGKPEAIIVMSAHFETPGVAVVTDPAPGMIYDFGGFQPELYEMVYPAKGDPEMAIRVVSLLANAGLEPRTVDRRGYDHGTWVPLKIAFPEADIPVVQISIDPQRDARWHWQIGQALAPLREEGVLLIGSGHITHNLRTVFGAIRNGRPVDPEHPGQVDAFTTYFADAFAAKDRNAVLQWEEKAPFASENHPTDEHLLPLFFAYGAAGDAPDAKRAHSSKSYGFFANDSWIFH